jgi:release factor glutamine methyltransferase
MNATETAPWTVARLLTTTREYLQRHGVELPRLCAEILLAHALGCDRIRLFTEYEAVPGDDARARFRELVKQAATGRPIAYLTGVKEFFSLPFRVTPDVLIPRPETEILVERAIDLVRKSGGALRSVLDLGTGSGCIAISLARHLSEAEIFASDLSEAALRVARENADRLGVSDRITFRCGDLFTPWSELSAAGEPRKIPPRFDVIVANLPYVSTEAAGTLPAGVRDAEPHAALFAGRDGLDLIRRAVAEAPCRLSPAGHLLLEIGFDQADKVRGLLSTAPWDELTSYRDGAGFERVFHVKHVCAATQKAAG